MDMWFRLMTAQPTASAPASTPQGAVAVCVTHEPAGCITRAIVSSLDCANTSMSALHSEVLIWWSGVPVPQSQMVRPQGPLKGKSPMSVVEMSTSSYSVLG